MIVAKYFTEFIVYSFIGWIYECTYCSIKSKHWSNRGFLYGPVCPIYGVGAVLCSMIFGNASLTVSGETPLWEIFVICAFGSAILEYSTSYLLERYFHALWWDYSNIPFNIHGRICLPVTMAFGFAGIVVVKFVLPFAESVKADMNPIFAEVLALMFMAILAADLALTVQSLVDLTARLDSMENEFNIKVEEKYRAAIEVPSELKEKYKAVIEMPAELRDRYDEFTEKLTVREKYSLYSIKTYTSQKTRNAASKVRNYMDNISDKLKREKDEISSEIAEKKEETEKENKI